ncbi:hypothetical protein QBC44DRAFT_402430 [Cladorrhinum sp. PSN332]|nr:hypothetical protein QBC44DRAFT_402430 [Cladorrhinum sp. PSN332]
MGEQREDITCRHDVLRDWIIHYACKVFLLFYGFVFYLSEAPALGKFEYVKGFMLEFQGFQSDEAKSKFEVLLSLPESPYRCMTVNATIEAIHDPQSISNVSGWYGPGTYLSWLITAYAASLSSIWHSKSSTSIASSNTLDPDLILTLLYPLLAISDMLFRLTKCHIGATLPVATFVLLSSHVIMGPATRLSRRNEESPCNAPQTLRDTATELVQFLGSGILWSLHLTPTNEPYLEERTLWTVVALSCFTSLYAFYYTTTYMEEHPYKRLNYRPKGERVLFFCIVQVIFYVVLLSTNQPLLPVTGSSIWDFDQAGQLLCTVLLQLYCRGQEALVFNSHLLASLTGFGVPWMGFLTGQDLLLQKAGLNIRIRSKDMSYHRFCRKRTSQG